VELEQVGVARSGRRRIPAWLPILLPVVLLVGVVAGGLAGRPEPPPAVAAADPSTRASAEEPLPEPTRSRTPRATVPPAPLPQTGAPLPGRIVGLEVEDVTDARDGPRRSRPNELVAIRGWLTVAPGDPTCERSWYLACGVEGTLTAAASRRGPWLRVRTQPGVPLLGLQRQDALPGTWSVPNHAIVIGRFTSPLYRECGIPVAECEPLFTVERLAWVRRSARERPVAFGPGVGRAGWSVEPAETAARAALDGPHQTVGETLVLSLVDAATLAAVDPIAAAAANAGTDAELWYLRAIVWRDDKPVVAWAVVDDAGRRVLATGA
jgi:hypothetical protein